MTIQAIPLPELGSYSGSELMMQAQGFTLDGLGLLTKLSYIDNGLLHHAAWTYDLAAQVYTTSINAAISSALGLDSQDLAHIEVHDVQAFASAGQRGIAALYTQPGIDDVAHIALLVGNSVTVVDVLTGATSPDASHAIRRFAISEDGRFVALQTSADLSSDTDLMAGMADVNEADDIYLLDRDTQKITRVSVVAGDAPLVPSQLGDIAVRNGLVQISFVSEAAFTAQDSNANTNDAIDAYLWSQSFSPTGLIGQSTLSLLSGSGNSAIGGMSVASDGQPEFAGPLITAAGIYFNSSSAQLASADQNESADVFLYRNAQTQRLSWTGQPTLDFGATVIGTSSNGQIAGLMSSSSAVSGSYGGTQLLVIDTASGNSTVLPTGTSTAADGSIVSAAMSPNGALAAFTWNAISPLVGSKSLPEGTLYIADTGFRAESSRLTLTATHWKTGKGALSNVDIGITQDGTRLKTAADGRISAQGFTDPDSVDDGHTVLKPQLGAIGAQASITLTDVLGALKVYLNKPLDAAYDSPYKYIAADFQGDGDVDLSDVLSLLKYYLKKPVDAAPSWVFVDSAHTVTVGGKSLPVSSTTGQALSKSHAVPADIDVDLNSDTPLQLIGVLRGDLDGSASV